MKKFQFQVTNEDTGEIVQSIKLVAGREYLIGRSKLNNVDIVLDNQTISRHHAKLTVGQTSVSLEDMGSVNGTFKNGVPIKPKQFVLMTTGIQIKFAESPFLGTIITTSADNDDSDKEEQSRSRSRDNEKKKALVHQQPKNVIKKENQIWNMGDLNENDKKKMMRLMGVKDDQKQENADLNRTKQEIKFRNYELERQYQLAQHHRKKGGLGL